MNSVISTAGLLTPTGKIRFFLTFSWYVDMVSSLLHHTTEKKKLFSFGFFFRLKQFFITTVHFFLHAVHEENELQIDIRRFSRCCLAFPQRVGVAVFIFRTGEAN